MVTKRTPNLWPFNGINSNKHCDVGRCSFVFLYLPHLVVINISYVRYDQLQLFQSMRQFNLLFHLNCLLRRHFLHHTVTLETGSILTQHSTTQLFIAFFVYQSIPHRNTSLTLYCFCILGLLKSNGTIGLQISRIFLYTFLELSLQLLIWNWTFIA